MAQTVHWSPGMAKKYIVRVSHLLLAIVLLGASAELTADDGWRRTAQGWEHKSGWELSPFATRPVAPQQSRSSLQPVVFHPGGVALLQVAASCVVLGLFAPTRLKHPNPQR